MGDIERICSNRDITKRLSKVVTEETLWQRVYIFCKHLAKFIHAPITLNDYKRMEKYTEAPQNRAYGSKRGKRQ